MLMSPSKKFVFQNQNLQLLELISLFFRFRIETHPSIRGSKCFFEVNSFIVEAVEIGATSQYAGKNPTVVVDKRGHVVDVESQVPVDTDAERQRLQAAVECHCE
jgi:hypothetical protein